MNDTTRAHATLLRRWYLFIGLLLLLHAGHRRRSRLLRRL